MDFRPLVICSGETDRSSSFDDVIVDQVLVVKLWWHVVEKTAQTRNKRVRVLFCHCCSHQYPTQLCHCGCVAVDSFVGPLLTTPEQRCNSRLHRARILFLLRARDI